jgi:dehydratase
MTRLAPPLGRLVRVSALALIALLAVPSAASAATAVPAAYDCQARSPLGGGQQLPLNTTIQATAPATVSAGGSLVIILAADPMTVPAAAGGYSVQRIGGLALKVPVPEGTTYDGAKLVGGSGLGAVPPSVSQANNVVTVVVPGPIAGGATFQLPALHLALHATGAAGTKVASRLSGTSYIDPGLLFIATVKVGFFGIDVPVFCFPNPSPTLTSTTISAA